jgi:hypothetical protein
MSRHWDISSVGGLGDASHFGRSVSQSKRLKIDDFTGLVLFLFVSLMGELAALAHPGNVPLRRKLASWRPTKRLEDRPRAG